MAQLSLTGRVNLYKLKYRVVFCSGEDPEFPVSELLDNSPQSKGWQSAKFCQYPQEIILQFTNIVKLKQIQLLSHQSKISSRIELYTFVPSGQQALSQQIPLNQIDFRKLGYLGLDSNERSGFQARELKSVYVDQTTLLLKIVFQKCYVNKYNLHNQVGLIAINCMGEMYNTPQLSRAPTDQRSNTLRSNGSLDLNQSLAMSGPNLEDELNIDKNTLETLKELYIAKDEAVSKEDFDEAKRLKTSIDRLKSISMHLGQLEERKRLAIVSEDYDAAKLIKQEIEKLKRSALQTPEQPKQVANYSMDMSLPNIETGRPQQQQAKPNVVNRSSVLPPVQVHVAEERIDDSFVRMPQRGRQQEDAKISIDDQIVGGSGKSSAAPKKQQQPQQKRMEQIISHDDQVIPTLINKKGEAQKKNIYEAEDYGPDAYPNGKPETNEEIDPSSLKLAEPLFPVFGDQMVNKIFSKAWPTRDEGLKDCEEFVKTQLHSRSDQKQMIFQSAMIAVNHALDDKIAQVNTRGMSLLQTCMAQAEGLQIDAGSAATGIFNQLMNKLGDNNPRVREKAEEILLIMSTHGSFGADKVVSNILKQQPQKVSGKKGTQQVQSIRHLVGKLQLLHKVLELNNQHGRNEQVNYQGCFDYAVSGFKHQNADVRNHAFLSILQLYQAFGQQKMRQSLQISGLRQAQLDMLQEGFNQLDVGQGHNIQQEESKQTGYLNVAQNEDRTHSAKSIPQRNQKSRPPTSASQQNSKCQFCGRADKSFATQEAMDVHFWKDCPMLTECQYCSQVIEVESLNLHLLKECDGTKDFKECPRCRESIHSQVYDQHVSEKQCLISKPQKAANRCPLCHQDITPAGEVGWRRHLLEEGCPSNPRA